MTAKIGIKPDTAQAARHELVAQSKSQHKRLVAQAAIKQEPSVPVSELEKRKQLYAETIGTESPLAKFVQNEFSELIRQAEERK